MKLGIVILAAGTGTRMKSRLPKVLHELGGTPLLGHVIEVARSLQPNRIAVVYGHGGAAVPNAFAAEDLLWVLQDQQLGTGHAVQQAMSAVADVDKVLVLYGDVPLIRGKSLQRLIDTCSGSPLGVMTLNLDQPEGYGRIQRDGAGRVVRIVEQKDADAEQQAIKEINTGIMLIERAHLQRWLPALSAENAQGEYYLTDIVATAVAEGIEVQTSQPADRVEAEGVNDRLQLAELERALQQRQAQELMRCGVTLADPARFDLRGTLQTGMDVYLDVNVIIEGRVLLGDNVRVGANTLLRNVEVGDNVSIRENCVIEDAVIGEHSIIGPFARLRPGAHLRGEAHIGNFVEIKNSVIGLGSKVNHLSYIGDTQMGAGVNIGAGTITCNYDGANKHRTEIGNRAFIGSNSALVAPVAIGQGATIGAGSVINKDAPEEKLTLSRSPQVTLEAWKRPIKE